MSIAPLSVALNGFAPGQSPDLMIRAHNGFYPSDADIEDVVISANRTLLQAELQTTITSTYPDTFIDNMFTSARDLLKVRTRRSSFSKSAATAAELAVLYIVIDRLATNNRDLIKSSISEISENGAKIVFQNGKSLLSYRQEVESIIKDLRVRKTMGGGTYISPTTIY
ncbi:hypothetical protein [Methanosarcina sp.]|uniref:hypothetical protein n=1 Tax=Methanosarcina sp. TaxID=2213 RepID=UPI003BB7AF41